MEKSESEYKRLLKMLDSPDVENTVLALHCIDNMDFETNKVTILCLLKSSRISAQLWIDNANKTYNRIVHSSNYVITKMLSFNDILNQINGETVSGEQIDAFYEAVADSLEATIQSYKITIQR
jgi:hypothetical protein